MKIHIVSTSGVILGAYKDREKARSIVAKLVEDARANLARAFTMGPDDDFDSRYEEYEENRKFYESIEFYKIDTIEVE